MIYLDNAATTPLSRNVKKCIVETIEQYGNPSSLYDFSRNANRIVQESREKVAKAIDCLPEEIYFTSGASESNTWALAQADRCICSPVEHHSILNNPKTHIQSGTILLSNMLVNNETGEIYDVKQIFSKSKNLTHADATQAIGNIQVNVKELGVDMMSFSGHKFHAPKGIGCLYVRHGIVLNPLIYGGKQERGVRGGTENTIGVAAIGVAIEESVANTEKKNKYCMILKRTMLEEFNKSNLDYIVNGKNTISSTVSVSFKGVESEAISLWLNSYGICVSSGSACNSGSAEPSHVLKAIGCPAEYINGTIRFSFSLENTVDEVKFTCEKISEIIGKIKM
ncbi:MAG: cysteine desulfurase family protein [Bacteroidaceae bacterium]